MAGGPKILSNFTHIYTSTPYVAINHPLLTSNPQELSKLSNSLAARARDVVFSKMHRSVWAPITGYAPSRSASRGPTPLPCIRSRSPYCLSNRNGEKERNSTILYGTHASARNEADFIHAELAEQVQAGYVAFSPLEAFTALQKLWLSPVAFIPQVGRIPRLIF